MAVEVHENTRLLCRLQPLGECVAWVDPVSKDVNKVFLRHVFTLDVDLDVFALPVANMIVAIKSARKGRLWTTRVIRWQHEQNLVIRDALVT